MPTPRPIIEASVGATVGMSNSEPSAVIRANPVARPIRAVPIGRPIATTDPKATRRTITAATRPKIS